MNKLVIPSKKELLHGGVFLLAHLTLLPPALAMVFSLFPLSVVWQNTLYMLLESGILLWIFHGYLRQSVQQFSRQLWQSLGWATAGLALYLLLNYLLNDLMNSLNISQNNMNNAVVTDMLRQDFWPMVLCTVVLTPFAEEVLYRGILFAGLYKKSRLAAYALSMTVFSAIHLLSYLDRYTLDTVLINFLQYLPAGFVLAWSYAKTCNPVTPMLIHCAVNIIGILTMR